MAYAVADRPCEHIQIEMEQGFGAIMFLHLGVRVPNEPIATQGKSVRGVVELTADDLRARQVPSSGKICWFACSPVLVSQDIEFVISEDSTEATRKRVRVRPVDD